MRIRRECMYFRRYSETAALATQDFSRIAGFNETVVNREEGLWKRWKRLCVFTELFSLFWAV